jgi:hypothetical protein
VFEEDPRSVTREGEIRHHTFYTPGVAKLPDSVITLLRTVMVTLRNEDEKEKIGVSPFSLAARMRELSTTMRESLTLDNDNAKSPSNVTRGILTFDERAARNEYVRHRHSYVREKLAMPVGEREIAAVGSTRPRPCQKAVTRARTTQDHIVSCPFPVFSTWQNKNWDDMIHNWLRSASVCVSLSHGKIEHRHSASRL